jgi:hypothetical protein
MRLVGSALVRGRLARRKWRVAARCFVSAQRGLPASVLLARSAHKPPAQKPRRAGTRTPGRGSRRPPAAATSEGGGRATDGGRGRPKKQRAPSPSRRPGGVDAGTRCVSALKGGPAPSPQTLTFRHPAPLDRHLARLHPHPRGALETAKFWKMPPPSLWAAASAASLECAFRGRTVATPACVDCQIVVFLIPIYLSTSQTY